jgi:hypothetical protein
VDSGNRLRPWPVATIVPQLPEKTPLRDEGTILSKVINPIESKINVGQLGLSMPQMTLARRKPGWTCRGAFPIKNRSRWSPSQTSILPQSD